MNIDELEHLSEKATEGPWEYLPDFGPVDRMQNTEEICNELLCKFIGTHRKAIIRMLRAGEKMATTIEGELHSPKCHLNSSRPFGSKLREEWDAKGCDCWKSVLKEYQTAKESI